jgi:hypothetical protein
VSNGNAEQVPGPATPGTVPPDKAAAKEVTIAPVTRGTKHTIYLKRLSSGVKLILSKRDMKKVIC